MERWQIPHQNPRSCLQAYEASYIIPPPTKKQIPVNIDLQGRAPWLQKAPSISLQGAMVAFLKEIQSGAHKSPHYLAKVGSWGLWNLYKLLLASIHLGLVDREKVICIMLR